MAQRRTAGRAAPLALCVLALALAAPPAAAQTPPGGGTGGSAPGGSGPGSGGGRRGQGNGQPRPAPLPPVKITPDPWPRLDAGAVLCRTAEDLRQHRAALAARLDGSSGVPEPTGCHLVRQMTAVVVLSREGFGQTQVRLSDPSAETGWTDVFLPERKPGT